MWSRSIKNILYWIPAILILCLVSFLLLQSIPGDPVLARLQQSGVRIQSSESIYHSRAYRDMHHQLGQDKPAFYFSLRPASVPDSVNHIPHPDHQRMLKKWCTRFGNPETILTWYKLNMEILSALAKADRREEFRALQHLLTSDDVKEQSLTYRWLVNELALSPLNPLVIRAAAQHEIITSGSRTFSSYQPVLTWNGGNNQFHHWLWGTANSKGVLKGHFGISQRDGQLVTEKVWPAFKTTLGLAVISIVLMYLTAIPIGLRLARTQNRTMVNVWVRIIFGLYAMPGFWLGVLMLTFLCSPDFLNWFPVAYSLMDIQPETPWYERTLTIIYHLVLPVTAWSIGGAAFLTIQTLKQSKQLQLEPFITSARAKGLTEKAVTRRHIFKNALVPAVSMLGSIIPAALSGAIAIELIFSIPGMGQLIFNSFHTRDYPVVMAILILVGTAAIAGSALSDLILHRLDPRLNKEQLT